MRHAIATLILAVAAAVLWWCWSADPHPTGRSATTTESALIAHRPVRTPGRSAQIALRRGDFDPIGLIRVRTIDRYEGF